MWDCNKKHNTPINMHIKLQKAKAEYKLKTADIKWYQSAVGSLIYAMLGTHPNIAYAVLVISQFTVKPTQAYKATVTQIFRYLRKTVNYVLIFKGPLTALSSYSNSNQVGNYNTQKLTLGYIFNIGSAVISQSLKLQLTITLLLYKAKYIGQINATKEAIQL